MPDRRITIRDVAREAGVHFTTVARALRDHPRLSAATRKRIKAIAIRLGYRPDPMMSALTAYRTRMKPPVYHGNIAWIINHTGRREWITHEIYTLYFEGAARRAEELGYKLEEFWLHDEGMTPERATKILVARNIRGLLLCPQPRVGTVVQLDWRQFSAVTLGYSLGSPALHRVATHTSDAMAFTIEQVRARGYRRPGLVLSSSSDGRIFNLWSGMFLTHQRRWPPGERVPVFLPETVTEKTFARWFEKYRPDVIVSQDLRIPGWLAARGCRIPADVGFVTPSLVSHPRDLSGYDENSRPIGAAAMDLLAGMLQRNETGLPGIPYYLLVKGRWHEGRTLRKRSI
jgi:LacI family transcriptional regulator